MAQFRQGQRPLGMQNSSKRSVNSTINHQQQQQIPGQRPPQRGQPAASALAAAPSSSQDLSSSPFKKLKTSHGPAAAVGAAAGQSTSYATSAGTSSRPLSQKSVAAVAAPGRPAVRESKPWKTPQWMQAQSAATTPKRRSTSGRQPNYYEGYFQPKQTGGAAGGVGNQLLFSTSTSTTTTTASSTTHHHQQQQHQGFPSHGPPTYRGGGHQALPMQSAATRGGSRPAAAASSTTYRPNPITSRTIPAAASTSLHTNKHTTAAPPNGYAPKPIGAAAVVTCDLTNDSEDDQSDGFMLKSLDFRGTQSAVDAATKSRQQGASAAGTEMDAFAEDAYAFALALGEEEEKARQVQAESYRPVPLGTTARSSYQPPPPANNTSTKSSSSLAPVGRGAARQNVRNPPPQPSSRATSTSRETKPANAPWQPQQQQQQQQQKQGNKVAPILLVDESEAQVDAPKVAYDPMKHESSNSESYDDDSGWLYDAIVAESDIAGKGAEDTGENDKKRKRGNGYDGADKPRTPSRSGGHSKKDYAVPTDEPSSTAFSSGGDSLLAVPQTNPDPEPSLPVAAGAVNVQREPDGGPIVLDGGLLDDLILVQALEQHEGGKQGRKDESLPEVAGVPSSSTFSEGDDILSINPLASTGFSVPEHVPSSFSSSSSAGSVQVPASDVRGQAPADDVARVKQENYQLAQAKTRAEEEKERLERELMAMRRQMQQMKAEQEASIEHLKKNVKSATASRATLEEKNTTLNQRLVQDSRSLQRQITTLSDQLAFKDRELAGAEETKRRLLAELEEERKRKLLPTRPAVADDDERLKTLAVSRREKRSSTSGASREAEERASREAKLQSTGLAPLVRMSEVGILHHLLDENMSGHLFTLLGSNAANSTSLAQANADVASTESSASAVLLLFRNHSSQSLRESQTESERTEMQDKRRKLAQELRLTIAKVLHERASLATMLPLLSDFIVLVKKRAASSGGALPHHHKAKERSELSTSTSAAAASPAEDSAAMSLLFSALSVLHVLVDGSERCRRAILWDDKDELEERERRKNESAAANQGKSVAAAAAAVAPPPVKIEVNGEEPTHGGVMAPHSHLRSSRILVGRPSMSGGEMVDKMEVESKDKAKGKEKMDVEDDEQAAAAREALRRTRSLASLFLLGKDSELDDDDNDDYGDACGEGEQDFFAMLAQHDAQHGGGESSLNAAEDLFQLLPPYLDAIRGRQSTVAPAATNGQGTRGDGAAGTTTTTTSTLSAREMLQQAKIKSRAQVHVPKLLGLLINRVLKRREISLGKHGEIISKTLQVLNTLAWHCPSHLLHKFEPLFTTNLLFSFLGRTTSLPIKELTVDILLNLFRIPSYLPMLKKTANGGLTLLDRAIKYLGAEQYDPAEIRSLRCKVIRLVSLVEMKYKDVSFEVLHSKKEKATNLFVSLGVSLCAEVEALQNLPHTDPSAGSSASLIRDIVNLLLLLLNHLGSETAVSHATPALHYYHRATNLLASQAVHGLVADLATSAAHVHASIFREHTAESAEEGAVGD